MVSTLDCDSDGSGSNPDSRPSGSIVYRFSISVCLIEGTGSIPVRTAK